MNHEKRDATCHQTKNNKVWYRREKAMRGIKGMQEFINRAHIHTAWHLHRTLVPWKGLTQVHKEIQVMKYYYY